MIADYGFIKVERVGSFEIGKKYSDEELETIVRKNFDFSVSNIIRELDLRRPIYTATTNYGHFGKKDLPWEQFKKIEL